MIFNDRLNAVEGDGHGFLITADGCRPFVSLQPTAGEALREAAERLGADHIFTVERTVVVDFLGAIERELEKDAEPEEVPEPQAPPRYRRPHRIGGTEIKVLRFACECVAPNGPAGGICGGCGNAIPAPGEQPAA